MKPPGLRAKLTIIYTSIFAALLGGLFVAANFLLANQLDDAATNEVIDRGTALRGYFHFDEGGPTFAYDPEDSDAAFFVRNATRYYEIYNLKTGTLIVQSTELQLLGLSFTAAQLKDMLPSSGPTLIDVNTDQGGIRFFNDRVTAPDGTPCLLQVGVSLNAGQQAVERFVHLALWLVPVGIFLAAAGGWLLAGRALAPVRALARAAEEIEVSQLSRRLPVGGASDELDQMARTFNDMFARLETAIGEMKQFTASVGHELRTPLAVLRGEAEVALMQSPTTEDYKRLLVSQIEEFDKLGRLINQLLMLARAEAGEVRMESVPVDVGGLLENLIETFSLIAEEKHVQLSLHLVPGLTVPGDAVWLESAFLNLMDNAIKFTPPDGRVVVSATQGDGEVLVAIEDNGTGVPEDALPHIFERFYRADPSRSKQVAGVGLGLSLVKWIINQHRGTIDVSSTPGLGSRFVVHLPGLAA